MHVKLAEDCTSNIALLIPTTCLQERCCACYRQGRYNLDPNVKFFATPPVHGSLAKYVDHPADFCFKMPDSLSYEQGAMAEPLSNAGVLTRFRHIQNICINDMLNLP